MNTYPASECLIGLADDEHGNASVYGPDARYKCALCGTETTFEPNKKTTRQDLSEPFERATGPLKPYEEDFCDFDCHGCGAHIRMVYDLFELSMARYRYYPKTCYAIPSSGRPSITPPPKKASKVAGCLYVVLGIGALVMAMFFAE